MIEALIQAQQVKPKTLHRIHYTDATIEMVNANLGISVIADWIVEPYLKNKNIVSKPMHHSVASRSWFAATCKQTPAIQNFLECLKMYFSGADMSVDLAEKEQLIQQHAAKIQFPAKLAASTAVFTKPAISATMTQEFKNYQY